MTLHKYTTTELDQLVGTSLYLGRLHNALATMLDVTRYTDDIGLIDFLNLADDMSDEVLPATLVLAREVHRRCVEIETAVSTALGEPVNRDSTDELFEKIVKEL